MDRFSIELAGVPMEIQSRYNYCRWFCRNYLTSREPSFSVYVEDSRLEEMREYNADMRDEFLERDGIYSVIASKLPYYNRVTLHGACISYRGKGYLFTAASGTGKSTHIGLWKQYVGADVDIVNGDKPIFQIEEKSGSTKITAYDTPWCGKEGWNRKHSAEVAAICFIRRTEDGSNHIRRVSPEEAISIMLRQMFHPYEPEATGLMLELFDKMIENLPLYLLECDISEDAVRCSFEALTGEKYISRGIQNTLEEINQLWRMPNKMQEAN
ncbi:MAG: hypothetical protein LUH42_08295 [Oscillospiraceae bacterium]|nr:hypothetical protein [Oscillospiraceae bacterium]